MNPQPTKPEHPIKTASRGVRDDAVHLVKVVNRMAEEIANDDLLDKAAALELINADVCEAVIQVGVGQAALAEMAGIPVPPEDLESIARPIDQNKLAERVKAQEGGKVKVSIAQVKEIQGIVLDELAAEVTAGNAAGVLALLRKRAGKK